MSLFHRRLGPEQGRPLLLLHGLLGSGDNLLPLAQGLAERSPISLPDLPGHGQSPRSPQLKDLSLESLAAELLAHADSLGWQRFGILGHSLGGRLAMRLALDHPQRVERILVGDMAPREYPPLFPHVFEALHETSLAGLQGRRELDQALAGKISDAGLRAFLLKSLQRNAAGELSWRFDLEGLEQARPSYRQALQGRYEGPALFVRGGRSDYVRSEDAGLIASLFPQARIASLEEAGHWLHVDDFEAFLGLARAFFAQGQP